MFYQTEDNYVIDFKRILNTADVKKAKNVEFLTFLTGYKLDRLE